MKNFMLGFLAAVLWFVYVLRRKGYVLDFYEDMEFSGTRYIGLQHKKDQP